ncbi:MAG: hypothetical protein AB7G17_05510 [Phycisphaerales bacterium]
MSIAPRTLALTLVVTLLIWLYAEAESLTRVQHEAKITLVSAPDSLIARPVDGWSGTARLTLEGGAAALARAPRTFELRPGAVGVPTDDGEHIVDLRVALRADPALAQSGLSLIAVEPPTVRIRVRAMETITDLEIRPDLGAIDLASPATIEPARASVSLPRSLAQQLQTLQDGAHLRARPNAQALQGLREGQNSRVRVRLSLPPPLDDPDVVITPREADVSVTLRARTSKISLPPVPVQTLLPPADAGRFRIVVGEEDRFLRDVSISGPSDIIQQIQSREWSVVAVVVLSTDDLEQRVGSKRAAFALIRDGMVTPLPPGVDAEATDTTIRLTIEPAPAGSASATPPAP